MMKIKMPPCDDLLLWNTWLSTMHFPVIVVSDELNLFDYLFEESATLLDISNNLNINQDTCVMLLNILDNLGFIKRINSKYFLTIISETYLVKTSDYYWGGVFKSYKKTFLKYSPNNILDLIQNPSKKMGNITNSWKAGIVSNEDAKIIFEHMHSHSFPAAIGFAHKMSFLTTEKVLDIGGGSGCFSLALSMFYPKIECTIVDLPIMKPHIESLLLKYFMKEKVQLKLFNMFKEEWPLDKDILLFSNILHDWDREDCLFLLKKARKSLGKNGKLIIHEMINSDCNDTNLLSALFSLEMYLGTMGKQFTGKEIEELLSEAKFKFIKIVNTYGNYWTIIAEKD